MGMNQDIVEGKWKQVKGSLRESWGRLTDDDLETLQHAHQDEALGGEVIFPTEGNAVERIRDEAHRDSAEGPCPLVEAVPAADA